MTTAASANASSRSANAAATVDRVRVLVVEDEVMIAILLEDMLEELGCKLAATASRLDEALSAVEAGGFDFAILDVNLGGDRTFPIADVLRRRGVPFAFATGYGAAGLPEAYRGTPVIQKPFRLDELSALLPQATAGASAARTPTA